MVEKKPGDEQKKKHDRESLIETLESIVVAFILAFIFRAFVVEAFVIPTGSMAPELNGQHQEVICPDCGYEFAFGIDENRSFNHRRVSCPNCLRQIQNGEIKPLVFSGDRILVLKFIYHFWEPERWDVIVFKNPNKPKENENYIKRLVGLPGDKISIFRGDVYINGEIARKPDKAQSELWMLVHDTLYRPARADWRERWETTGNGGWRTFDGGFELAAGRPEMAFLTYQHRDDVGQPDNIHDITAYGWRHGNAIVTDLSLRTRLALDSPEARIRIILTAYKDIFEFDLAGPAAGGKAKISINGTVRAETDAFALPIGKQFELQVANVDHKLILRLNGRRIFDLDNSGAINENDDLKYEPTELTDAERAAFQPPDTPASMVKLGIADSSARVARLLLQRDVYYTDEKFRAPDCDFQGRKGYKQERDPGWATQGKPVELAEDEFFVLGDNSPHSLDSRLWWNRGPRSFAVPRENLLGKAFFVYWPAAGPRYGIPFMPDVTGWRMVH